MECFAVLASIENTIGTTHRTPHTNKDHTMKSIPRYKVGTPVVFRMSKRSPHPGPRAEQVQPEPMGEGYQYVVDKYWIVADIRDDGQLVLRTRRGKTHLFHADHPALRPANLLERLFKADRFPKLDPLPPREGTDPFDSP